MSGTLRRAGLFLVFTILLSALILNGASAASIKLGPMREQTVQFLMDSKDLSRPAAELWLKSWEKGTRSEVIESVPLPDVATVDYVNVNSAGPGPTCVEHTGCGLMFSPDSEYGRQFWAEVQKMRGTPSYDYFTKVVMKRAWEQGFFVQQLTPQQIEQLRTAGLTNRDRAAAQPTELRILVVGTQMPAWRDQAANANNLGGHVINSNGAPTAAERGATPGGRWGVSGGAWRPLGQNNPAWNEFHEPLYGSTYNTGLAFRNAWFTRVFDASNASSLTSYYTQNSHGRISITGGPTDVAAWMDSHHITDRNPVGAPNDWAPMVGTPVIRTITGGGVIHRASLTDDAHFAVLFRDTTGTGRSTRSNYQFSIMVGDPAVLTPVIVTAGTVYTNPYDTRHVVIRDLEFDDGSGAEAPADGEGWRVTFTPTGTTWQNGSTGYASVGNGCAALPNTSTTVLGTTVRSSEVIQTDIGKRLLSWDYYTHDHDFQTVANRPYQLAHTRNGNNRIDDIQGESDSTSDHVDRPFPYDFDANDVANRFNSGLSMGTHSAGFWRYHVGQVLADNGINTGAYNSIFYVYPTGADQMTPHASLGMGHVTVNEDASMGLLAHEFGHNLSLVDLYDTDNYYNGDGNQPPHFISHAMGPYSVMASGARVDAFSKLIAGVNGPWVDPTILAEEVAPGVWQPRDKVDAPIPEIEGTLESPVIYRASPDFAVGNKTNNLEFFLVENRNRNGGAYYGDQSQPGMYIYHIDNRNTDPFTGMSDEKLFRCIIEQADGLYELETLGAGGNPAALGGSTPLTAAMIAGDPFPGTRGLRSFTQYGDPNSRSHGLLTAQGALIPASSYDTFFRVSDISDPSTHMTADLWVEPRELIVTGTNWAPASADQGTENVPVLGLRLFNDSTVPNLSVADVVVRGITLEESGNSKDDADLARALIYDDVGADGLIVPGTDVLLQAVPVVSQIIDFDGLSIRVPVDGVEDLLVAFDIAETAQTNPAVTVGSGIEDPWDMTAQIPGAIQERDRGTDAARFPIRSLGDRIVITEAPDTVTLVPTDVANAPVEVLQGTQDVEMLALQLSVDRDSVILDTLRVDARGTSNRPGDVSAELYDDANLNTVIDGGDTLIDSANFVDDGGAFKAIFDDLKSYEITDAADRGLIIAYDFAADASPGKDVNARLVDESYIVLQDAVDLVSKDNFTMASRKTLIVENSRPTLTDNAGGNRGWLDPKTGTPTTDFLWEAIYTDADNEPPTPIQVVIDGTAYDMSPVNPVDTDYTDGALFRYTTRLPVGNHDYYMFASDGSRDRRFPKLAPNVFDDPTVINTPSVLSNGMVSPARGDTTTSFLYEITFTDADGHAAATIDVIIDGGSRFAMTERDALDTDTTDGKVFEFALPGGILLPGAHKATFEASDGYDTVTWPSAGEMTGPIVSSPSSAYYADAAYNGFGGPYEENDPVFAQITDSDQNLDVGAPDTVTATITVLNGGDIETLVLTETANDSGIFRTGVAGVPSLGAVGAADDGVINAIGGPTGNTLQLDYVDPLDPLDVQSLQVGLVDTTAPAKVVFSELAAAADTNGATITVDWTLYNEAAQIDVVRYDVFYELVAGGDISTLTPVAQVPAGTQTVQFPTGGPNGDKYVAVAVYDEVPNVRAGVKWKKIGTADTEPPMLTNESPADASTEQALGSNITFDLQDTGAGVDLGTITATIQQSPADGAATDITASLVIGGTPALVNVSYNPPADFLYNQTVTVTVTASDLAGNAMTDSFSFGTITDVDPPVLNAMTPADGQTEVPLNTNISFRLDDLISGVDTSTIVVTVNGTDVTADVVPSGPTSSIRMDYDPPTDFLYNQTVTVTVDASDIAGNAMATGSFSFSTITDLTPPAIQNMVPADGDVDVPVDTDISFELTDAISGVDATAVHVTVNGTNVDASLVTGGTPDLTTVTYDPPLDFNYGATITVTVDAADVAGNVMSTASYSFDTVPDTDSVIIDQFQPADGAVDVPIDTKISFRVVDSVSGPDPASITLRVNSKVIALGPGDIQPLSPTAVLVTYDPGGLKFSLLVNVKATAQDIAGNPTTTANWSFTTEDPPTYQITGTITEDVAGTNASATQGVPGVKVSVTNRKSGQLVMTAITAGTGVFIADGLFEGNYIIEPTLTDYSFVSAWNGNPTQQVFVGLTKKDANGDPLLDASGVDFKATRTLYTIQGTILEGGTPLAGVSVSDGTRPAVTTDASGEYTIADVPSGIYVVVPTLTNYTFSPANRTAVVAGADATGIDFTATAKTFTLSGTVTDVQGNRLSGVEVRMQGGTGVAVSSTAGQYTLTGVKAGYQTLEASRTGYVFEPGPGVTVSNLLVDADMTGVDFVGYPVLSRSFGAGRHFIGLPVEPRNDDPVAVFGTTSVARYAADANPSRYFTPRSDPGSSVLAVGPGKGFFVELLQTTEISAAGVPVSITAPYAFVIDDGWTMAANPFPTALEFANLVPNVNDAMLPYGFVLENGSYTLVSALRELGARTWIDGWEGLWLFGTRTGTTVTALAPGSGTAAVAEQPQRTVDRDNWLIQIVAGAAGSTDASNAVGTSSTGAISVPNPPPLGESVDVIVRGANGQALAYDLRDGIGNGVTWEFDVVAPMQQVDVVVTMPDLSEVPADMNVTLVDVSAGKRLYARAMPSYVYSSGQGGVREFQLEVSPRTTAGLTIRPAGASVNARAASIAYVLSAEADVYARVTNLAGRPVRTLSNGEAASAGTNTLMWNLMADTQTRVPNGTYMVVIEAVGADGQRVKALQAISVAR